MMKINLLEQEEPDLKLAAGSSAAARQVLVFAVALAISMSTSAFVYFYWSRQVSQQQTALTRERIRQKELASVRARNQEYQHQLRTLEERIQTIQKLQAMRQGPVDLMTGLGETVNQTRDLYLLQVTPEGEVLHIRGEARRIPEIAQFMKALVSSPRFADVKLKQYYQDDQHGRTNFKFNLDCAYVPPREPGSEAGGKPSAAGQPPAGGK